MTGLEVETLTAVACRGRRQCCRRHALRTPHPTAARQLAAAASAAHISSSLNERDADVAPALSGPGGRGSRRSALDGAYLRGLLWAQRRDLVLALAAALLCTASNLAAPVLSGFLIEVLAGRQPASLYPRLLGVMAGLYTLEPLLGRFYAARAIAALERVLAAVRAEAFRVLLMQPVAFFDRHGTSDLTAALAVDLDAVRACVFANISRDRGLRALLEAAGSILVLFALSWQLAPALAAVIVATGVAAALFRRQTRAIEARLADALACLSRVAGQAFANIRTVRSFAGENLERERFQRHVAASFTAGIEFADAKAWLEAANRGAIHASLVALYALGGWLVASGRMPLRVMLTGIGFTYSLMYATQGVVNSLGDVRKATSAFERVRTLLNSTRAEPQVEAAVPPGEWWLRAPPPRPLFGRGAPAAANGADAGLVLEPWLPAGAASACPYPYRPMPDDVAEGLAARGDVVLDRVTFAYPLSSGSPVLDGVSLTLPRGETTALVGRSGAGKSTIASLIARFYAPTAGAITLGGADIGAWSRSAWSSAVALVAQDPALFAASVADNIAYGRPRASRAEVEGAARTANAHDFIMRLPHGYDTLVGERGIALSGGQRQRVAIARALLKDAPILILDEATSSLDAVTERLVSEAVSRLVAGRTVLVIAHRLATIERAARVIVLADGAVVESGTHAELREGGGAYAELVDSQRLSLRV